MSRTQPPRTGAAEPIRVVPRPRTVTGTRWRCASPSITPMSATRRGLITATGRNEILLLSKEAAKHAAGSVRTTRAPSRRWSCWVAER